MTTMTLEEEIAAEQAVRDREADARRVVKHDVFDTAPSMVQCRACGGTTIAGLQQASGWLSDTICGKDCLRRYNMTAQAYGRPLLDPQGRPPAPAEVQRSALVAMPYGRSVRFEERTLPVSCAWANCESRVYVDQRRESAAHEWAPAVLHTLVTVSGWVADADGHLFCSQTCHVRANASAEGKPPAVAVTQIDDVSYRLAREAAFRTASRDMPIGGRPELDEHNRPIVADAPVAAPKPTKAR